MFKKCLLIVLSALLLGGCFSPKTENIEKESYPCISGNILIEKAPEKIAVLSPELENILTAFSLENTIVGVSTDSSRECPIKIGTELSPDIEKIIESGAEYLFSLMELSEKDINSLSEKGVRAFVLQRPSSSAALKEIYDAIGNMFFGAIEAPKKSESAFAPYKKALEELKSKTGDSSFLYLSDRDLSQPIDTFSFGILSEIFKSGSENAAISEDELAAINPTYIFISGSLDEAYLLSLPAAENLSAVENGSVLSIESDFFEDFSPNKISALTLLIKE
jgi:ABC-type Fe3+-hydroxamate transport system substrate-binding protein